MYVENVKADHDGAWTACNNFEDDKDTLDLPEDQPDDNRRLEKRIADYIKVLRPGILVSADEELIERLLVNLQGRFHRATPKATVESLCDDVLRTRARTIVLVGSALDADEVSRKTRCYCLTLRGGAA